MKNKDLKENLGEIGGTEAKGKKKMDENKKNIILAAIIGALAGAIITTSIFLVINSNKKLNSNGRFTNDNFSQMERGFKGKGNMMGRPEDMQGDITDTIPEGVPEDINASKQESGMQDNLPNDIQRENSDDQNKNDTQQKTNVNNDSKEKVKETRTENKQNSSENI